MKAKYAIYYSKLFKKQRKAIIKRGYNIAEMDEVIAILANGESLPPKYNDHALKSGRKGQRDCHIQPDWILIYEINANKLILLLCETGTHSDLFLYEELIAVLLEYFNLKSQSSWMFSHGD